MGDRVLFVDLENVQRVDLSQIPADARVMIFCGAAQKKLPTDLVERAQPFGSRLQWIKVPGQGPNALDFFIAFYLGKEMSIRPKSECVILSGDAGFDPLMRHLQALGHTCHLVSALKEAFPTRPVSSEKDPFTHLLTLLKKEKTRPTRLKGLANKIKCWFPQSAESARKALLDRLISECRVRESGKTLIFNL